MKLINLLCFFVSLTMCSGEEINNQGKESIEIIKKCIPQIMLQFLTERFPITYIEVFSQGLGLKEKIPLNTFDVNFTVKGDPANLQLFNGTAQLNFLEHDSFQLLDKSTFMYAFKLPKIENLFQYSVKSQKEDCQGQMTLYILDVLLNLTSVVLQNTSKCAVQTPSVQLSCVEKDKYLLTVADQNGENCEKLVGKIINSFIGQHLTNIIDMIQNRVTNNINKMWKTTLQEATPMFVAPDGKETKTFCQAMAYVSNGSLNKTSDPSCQIFV